MTTRSIHEGVGAARLRLEDDGLLRGREQFTGDMSVAGMLYAKYVRSAMAHARIASIDTADAVASPGVVAVLTADDLNLGQIFHPVFATMMDAAYHRPAIARDIVRFVGEILAVVVADSRAAAIDGTELVVVDYQPLDVVIDLEEAARESSPQLFSEGPNVAVTLTYEHGERPPGETVTVRARVNNHRMAVAPMEGAAILALPDGDHTTIWVSTQMPHRLRDTIAGFVAVEPDQLRVIGPAVGGGFGGKTPADHDYVVITAVARHLGRPIQWEQSRSENLLTMNARGHVFDVTVEAFPDGRIASLEADMLSDVGAYPGIGVFMPMTSRTLATGAYKIPHVRFDIRCVATNTAPMGAFRGAGRPEAIAMLERTMDVVAAELGIDPVEIRRRNLIQPEDFPYVSSMGTEYDTGDYERALDEALRLVGYDELRVEQARRRGEPGVMQLGIGVSMYVEVSAGGASTTEYASVEITAAGGAEISVGTSAHGQGHWTTFAQIVSDVLGIPVADVGFVQSDTGTVPRGQGTGGSRSAQMGGSAVKMAATAVLDKARRLAAYMLEAAPDDVEVVPVEGLAVRGVPTSVVRWADLASAATDPAHLPDGMTPRLFEDLDFTLSNGTSPFGSHVAVVEVDLETGAVELRRFVAVDDCGVILNPLLAEGQVHGGLAAGIGQVLYEEIRYDADGNPLTTTFAEYEVPSAAEFPSFDTAHTVTPTPKNPLGAKGLGEAGTTGSIAAVHNAVIDALSHLGIRHLDLPASPLNVWNAVQQATATA